jgi:hypothetical protein
VIVVLTVFMNEDFEKKVVFMKYVSTKMKYIIKELKKYNYFMFFFVSS